MVADCEDGSEVTGDKGGAGVTEVADWHPARIIVNMIRFNR